MTTNLFAPVVGGNKYFIEGQVQCYADASTDYKVNLQLSSGTMNLATGFVSYNENPSAAGATFDTPNRTVWTEQMHATSFAHVLQVGVASTTSERLIIDWQSALDIATDGVYAVSWAQNTSSANAATTHRNSWLLSRLIDGVSLNGVIKSATESKLNTSTFANDTELTFAASASRIYRVQAVLNSWSNVNPDFKCRLAYSGTTLEFGGKCEANTVAGATSSLPTTSSSGPYTQEDFAAGTAFTMAGDSTTTFRGGVLFDCVIKTGTSGTFAVQWAPNVNTGSTSQMIEGSALIWEDITDAPDMVFAHKTSDEVRSSSATLTNDSDLVVTITPGEWIVEGYAGY